MDEAAPARLTVVALPHAGEQRAWEYVGDGLDLHQGARLEPETHHADGGAGGKEAAARKHVGDVEGASHVEGALLDLQGIEVAGGVYRGTTTRSGCSPRHWRHFPRERRSYEGNEQVE